MPTKGNPLIRTRVDPPLKVGLEAYALAKGITLSQLVRQVLMEFAHEVGHTHDGVCHTLDRITALIGAIEIQLIGVGSAGIQTQKEREQLYDTAVALLKEAVRLSESEEAAKNARARIDAMRLASTVSRTALVILGGYDRRDIEALVDELKKTNESIQARLRALEEGTTANTGGSPEKDSK